MALMEELSALYPMQTLHEMYELGVSDEEHSFWFIDLVARKKDDMFFVGFDHKLVLE